MHNTFYLPKEHISTRNEVLEFSLEELNIKLYDLTIEGAKSSYDKQMMRYKTELSSRSELHSENPLLVVPFSFNSTGNSKPKPVALHY